MQGEYEGDRQTWIQSRRKIFRTPFEHGPQGQEPDHDLPGERREADGQDRSFDKYSVLLENNSQEQLIFKHAISTVVSGRRWATWTEGGPERSKPRPSGGACAYGRRSGHG